MSEFCKLSWCNHKFEIFMFKKNKFVHGSIKLIILQKIRVVLASSGLLLFYMSYRYIPLPDVTTCRYTQVIWTIIIAAIVFHDRISISSIIASILTLSGVILVAQPTVFFKNHQILFNQSQFEFNQTNDDDFQSVKFNRLLGLSYGIGCALSISCSITVTKKLYDSKIPSSIIMLEFSIFSLFVLIIYHIYRK